MHLGRSRQLQQPIVVRYDIVVGDNHQFAFVQAVGNLIEREIQRTIFSGLRIIKHSHWQLVLPLPQKRA